jgi:hypothetical protein
VRQIPSTVRHSQQPRASVATANDEQHGLMRGVVHGMILSLAVWTAALYLTLGLR